MPTRPARSTLRRAAILLSLAGSAAGAALGASAGTALAATTGAERGALPAASTGSSTAPPVSTLPGSTPLAPEFHALPVCHVPTPGKVGCLAYELAPDRGSKAAAQLTTRARARVQAREQAASPTAAPSASATTLPAQLEASTEAAPEPQPVTPADLHSAYALPDQSPAGSPQQTIALVDAYNDPNAEADLKVYDRTFELPECTTGNGCFKRVNQNGGSGNLPFPSDTEALEAEEAICKRSRAGENTGERAEKAAACKEVEEATSWSVEISTDLDVAHSVCENCRIRLVEADSAAYPELETAERTAARPTSEGGEGATEISNSWGGEEPAFDSQAFEHADTVITAAAGDFGYRNWTEAETAAASKQPYYSGADYPASSPHVIAVGGTKLLLSAAGARDGESVWNEDPDPEGKNSGGGGGGCSTNFKAKLWQREVPNWSSIGCGTGSEAHRAVADVAADADPFTGVLVYDSSESKEFLLVIGGTSVASPIIASVFALVGGANEVEYPAKTLYAHLGSPALFDVTEGGNGKCDGLYLAGCSGSMDPLSPFDCGAGVLICNAAAGYDGPTGVGTPNGIAAFEPSGEEGKQSTEEKQHAEEKQRAEEKLREEKQREARELEERQRKEQTEAKERAEAEERQRQSGNTGGGTTQSTTGASGTSTGKAAGNATQGSPRGQGTTPGSSSKRPHTTVTLSRLALTANALAAIHDSRVASSQVAFAFTLSAAAPVRVTLARQVRVRGDLRWVLEPRSLTINARRGRNRSHLKGHATLPAGRYRVTLTPAHGQARALTFMLG